MRGADSNHAQGLACRLLGWVSSVLLEVLVRAGADDQRGDERHPRPVPRGKPAERLSGVDIAVGDNGARNEQRQRPRDEPRVKEESFHGFGLLASHSEAC